VQSFAACKNERQRVKKPMGLLRFLMPSTP
jgi:hypothetical protein